jgi:hypothetical protein
MFLFSIKLMMFECYLTYLCIVTFTITIVTHHSVHRPTHEIFSDCRVLGLILIEVF